MDTLNAALAQAVAQWPTRTFLKIDGLQVSFRDFDEQVGRLAAGLRAAGLKKDDRLVVFMRNSLPCLHSWFAANRLGAVWAPINAEFRGQGLSHVLSLMNPSLLICDTGLLEPLQEALIAQQLSPSLIIVGESEQSPSHTSHLTSYYLEKTVDPIDVSFADPSAILFTSGTTGHSKAARLSHRYFVKQASIIIRDLGLRQDDILYCPFPLSHADATGLTVIPALLLGGCAAISPRFSASRFWDEVRATGSTVFDFMGATLSILYKTPPRPDDTDNPVRLAWGVPVPKWAAEFERRFDLQIVELYGSTEANIPATQRYNSPRVPGSCGKATSEFELRIANDLDEEVPRGTVGDLLIRPLEPSIIMDGYVGMPEATLEVFRNLWFHTGDLARMDEDGNLFFVGRKKETIRRRGENISAFEIEEALLLHPAVVECAAIGVPSELTEEDVKICIVVRPDMQVDEKEILQHCTQTLARFQVPRYIEILPKMPRTSTGKIAKYQLKEAAFTRAAWDREATSCEITQYCMLD
ncbi:MAG TPA: AMP-binding protein [Ktedonobacteraceae bacterium]|jgi:crotonobetaine/carnitine-CoA ligase